MARRVIEGQVDVFEVLREGSEGGTTSSDPPQTAGHLPLPPRLRQGKAFGEPEVVPHGTRTSSVSARSAETPSPKGKAFGETEQARVLTLEALGGLEPFRAVVWIETRPWAAQRVMEESEACRFFLLFEAVFQTIGIPIGSERKHYHFKYTYTDGRNYYHYRVDEFYGQEWRVWDKCPTEAQRRETPWLSTR